MSSHAVPLLPCPWCGDDKKIEHDGEGREAWISESSAAGPVTPQFRQTANRDQIAIGTWNAGPYVDRFKAHAEALQRYAKTLQDQAAEHQKKAAELLAKAAEVEP